MPITFPLSPLTVVVEIALGVDPASNPAGWSWTNITSYVRYDPNIVITRGRRDESSKVDPASARLTLDNRDGRFCRRNPLGAYYGQLSKNTPIRIGVNPGTGTAYRFHGFVNEWPTRWSKDARDSTVPVTCAGILRRLTRNRKLGSAMFRTMSGITGSGIRPFAYWPMEDGSGATQFGSAASRVPPLALSSGTATLSSDSSLPGSASLPVLTEDLRATASLPAYTDTGLWVAQVAVKPGTQAAGTAVLSMDTSKGSVTVAINIASLALVMSVRDLNGNFLFVPSTPIVNVQGTWVSVVLQSDYQASGTDDVITAKVISTAGNVLASITQNVGPGVHGVARQPYVNSRQGPGSSGSYGHLGVWTDPGYTLGTDDVTIAQAMSGFTSERAGDRMIRLCREENVSFQLTGNANTTPRMGPQQNGTLLDLLRDCEAADHGLLYELEFGLGHLAQSQRYNLTSSMDLDFNAGDIAEPPEPADDDQQTVNQYTASRTSASSAISEDEGSVADDGLYAGSGTFNLADDTQLDHIASWKVHLGTIDEDRWPAIPIRLARTPIRITAWIALTIGGRMTAANPPDTGSPDTIDAIVEGWTETISPHMWEAVLNTSPTRPFEAFEIADQTFGRIETAGSIVNTAAASGATSLKLCTISGPLWITSAARPGDFPFDLNATGERVTATAMGSLTAASFVAAGTTASAVNAAVTPGLPAGHAAGDLLLLVAAVQNTGTGTVDTPAGYTRLMSSPSGNVRVFAKIDGGAEVVPTVTFTGSAATSDTMGVLFAFRDMCADLNRIVHNSASQANASGQNIATPALLVRQDNCLVVFVGWKQDDWTGSASPSGFTEILDAAVTAGDDMGLTVAYRIQSTAVDASPDRFTITGGLSAVSSSIAVALLGGTQTATVTRAVNGVAKAQAAGAVVSLWRPAAIAL